MLRAVRTAAARSTVERGAWTTIVVAGDATRTPIGSGAGRLAGAPVPLMANVLGALSALLATVSVPVRAPVARGVNVTPIVQLCPGATGVAQVLLATAKSPASVPPIAASATVRSAVPWLASVMFPAGAVVPTWREAKVSALASGRANAAGAGAG